ncbi:hypothetical protein, partial [Enterobacter hormaechei]
FLAYDRIKASENKMTVYYYRFMTLLFQLNEGCITRQDSRTGKATVEQLWTVDTGFTISGGAG